MTTAQEAGYTDRKPVKNSASEVAHHLVPELCCTTRSRTCDRAMSLRKRTGRLPRLEDLYIIMSQAFTPPACFRGGDWSLAWKGQPVPSPGCFLTSTIISNYALSEFSFSGIFSTSHAAGSGPFTYTHARIFSDLRTVIGTIVSSTSCLIFLNCAAKLAQCRI